MTCFMEHKRTAEVSGFCTFNLFLLFTRFQFTVAYRPCSCNNKANTLSRINTSVSKQSKLNEQDPILPSRCWVHAIQWDFDKEIENTLPCHSLEKCPSDHTYVPPRLRIKLITWAYTSPASGHPGTCWKLFKGSTGGHHVFGC